MSMQSKILATVLIALAAGPALAAQRDASAASARTLPAADKPVDNTKTNERDRNRDTTTPIDQPNDSNDIKLAAAVRQAIAGDKSLSTMAHNVKLVASSGVVTLRGPVANAGEKAKVNDLAAHVSGVTRVDNQLDVKAE